MGPAPIARTTRSPAGATHAYDTVLWSGNEYQEADLILPHGGRVHYVRITPSTQPQDAVFESTVTPTVFFKSRIVWNGKGWNLTLRDGTVLVYAENGPLQYVRDRLGNRIVLRRTGLDSHRNERGPITSVRSTSGRWIKFTNDGAGRVSQVTDNTGRGVGYTYDATGRLWRVTDPNGGITEYTYDASHRMLTTRDAKGIVFASNTYDVMDLVATRTDPLLHAESYGYDLNGNLIVHTDRRGQVTVLGYDHLNRNTFVGFNQVGQNYESTITAAYDPGNRVTSLNDSAAGSHHSRLRRTGQPHLRELAAGDGQLRL